MLDSLFTHPAAAPRLRSSPFGPWLDLFTDWLGGLGYTPWTCRSYAVLAADLGRWCAKHKKVAGALDESVVDSYIEQRKTQRERRRAAALRLLDHLRAEGTVPARVRGGSLARDAPLRTLRRALAEGAGRMRWHG